MRLLSIITLFILASCSVARKISKPAELLLNDPALLNAHAGVSIYDPATHKYLYSHDSQKFFVPASNTKLFSLYAGLLGGDSIISANIIERESMYIFPNGDPTFFNEEFPRQPLLDIIRQTKLDIVIVDTVWKEKPW